MSVLDVEISTAILGMGMMLLSYYVWSLKRPPGAPPGPLHVPLLGNIVMLGARDIKTFVELYKKYGKIYSMYVGNKLIVILNEFEVVQEAFIDKGIDCTGRPDLPVIQTSYNAHYPQKGIIDDNVNPEWKRQRSNALCILRSLGLGKHTIEDKIKEECDVILDTLHATGGRPYNPSKLLEVSVANIICSMLFGERYNYNDEEFQSFIHAICNMFIGMERCLITYYIPLLQPFLREANRQRIAAGDKLKKFIQMKLDQGCEKLKCNDFEAQDFVTMYIKETQKNSQDSYRITDNRSHQIVTELFMAGSETTATTLKWGLIYMANYPEVQQKVQEELDRELGKESFTYADQVKIPYTAATISEILRCSSIAPFALAHQTVKDVVLAGYRIPKGTEIWPCLYNIHHDENIWPEPFKIKPERFLNKEGQFNKRRENIPFSLGRRSCLGEQLARQELFLFFASILRAFKISAPDGANISELSLLRFVLHPHQYEVCFQPRLVN